MQQSIFPELTAVVMAHPDDEALWASSALSCADRIVICFEDVAYEPALSLGRRRSAMEYPFPNATFLAIPESGVFDSADWPTPVETYYGLAVTKGPSSRRGFSELRYRKNWSRLVNELRPLLAGRPSVITHSPWGEYGHEEHIQVFRAVSYLQDEMGFTLWVPGYVSNKSFSLMTRYISRMDSISLPLATNPELGARLQALYSRNECWTWFDDYSWPSHEHFYSWSGPSTAPTHPKPGLHLPMNVLWVDPRLPAHRQRPPWKRAFRRARRMLLR